MLADNWIHMATAGTPRSGCDLWMNASWSFLEMCLIESNLIPGPARGKVVPGAND